MTFTVTPTLSAASVVEGDTVTVKLTAVGRHPSGPGNALRYLDVDGNENDFDIT